MQGFKICKGIEALRETHRKIHALNINACLSPPLCLWRVWGPRCVLSVSLSPGLWGVPSCCTRQYHFVGLEKSWTKAQSYCRENYTDLAVIENREDNEQLLQTVGNPVQYAVWIGLYRDQWSWQWSMGNIHLYNQNGSNFTNWTTGQPENNGGKENCGIMASRGLWHDYPCSCSFHFICYQEKKRVVMSVGLQLEKGMNPNDPGVREYLLNRVGAASLQSQES
ncbi:LYAM1 protein, partial [Atractosteus spatula]|nr:LYAM1 protein [Atractosteus spatula]